MSRDRPWGEHYRRCFSTITRTGLVIGPAIGLYFRASHGGSRKKTFAFSSGGVQLGVDPRFQRGWNDDA